MKKLCFILVLILFETSIVNGQVEGNQPATDCSNYNAFYHNESLNTLSILVHDATPTGGVMIDPEKMDNGVTLDDIIDAMDIDLGTTFDFLKETPSRFSADKFYRQYQQLYNGLEVHGGGYTEILYRSTNTGPGPGGSPCDELAFVMPHILNDINITTVPSIEESDLAGILPPCLIQEAELLIGHNMVQQCEFTLAWKVIYIIDDEVLSSWIDAQTGEIFKTKEAYDNLLAPMANPVYADPSLGPGNLQSLNDRFDATDNKTYLESPDSDIKAFDFGASGADCEEQVDEDNWTSSAPSTSNPTIWGNEATPELYQAFFLTSEASAILSGIGIDFGTINVSTCTDDEAFNLQSSTMENTFIVFGELSGSSFALMDVVAHELAHSFIKQFLADDPIAPESLTEGLADIIAIYVESVFQNGNIDWIMGDDDIAIQGKVGRIASLPKCFTDVEDEENLPHLRGGPLTHWFFLITEGDPTNNIPGLGIEQALDIILEALPLVSRTGDYKDLKSATKAIAAREFGYCTDQYYAVARAWEQICVFSEPSPDAPQSIPDCNYSLSNPTSVCDEDGSFSMTFHNGTATNHLNTWTIVGRQSTNFTISGNQTGNSSQAGNSVTISGFPNYPYYPQTITAELWNPILGVKIRRRITIRDCDRSHPTCEEYYGLRPLSGNYDKEHPNWATPEFMKIFNLTGQIIYEGYYQEVHQLSFDYNGIVIIALMDKDKQVLEVKKSLLFK